MDEPVLRLATSADVDAIDALMKDSIRAHFPTIYDARQTESSVRYVGSVDRTLIEDGTYFVIEADSRLVACGGWSRRAKLYTGSADQEGLVRVLDPETEPAYVRAMFVHGDYARRGLGTRILEACQSAARGEGYRTMALMATLPGLPLYQRYGFTIVESTEVVMPDGVALACASMTMPIDDDRSA